MKRLENKVAIVTGGTKGIGEQAVRKFAREGAKVLYMGLEDHPHIAEELNAEGCDVTFFKGGDITKKDTIDAFVEETIRLYGRVDVLFAHAGGNIGMIPLHETTDEQWDFMMDLNLNGNVYMIKKCLPYMMENKSGSIIVTSSIASVLGRPGGPFMTSYCATKTAHLGLVRSIASDYAKYNIRANAIQPGVIATDVYKGGDPNYFNDRIPMGRPGRAEEVANLALFLASDESSYITGTSILVDGGLVLE